MSSVLAQRTHRFNPRDQWADNQSYTDFMFLGAGAFGCVFRGPYGDDDNVIIKVIFPRGDPDTGDTVEDQKRVWRKEALVGAALVERNAAVGPMRDSWVQTLAYGESVGLPDPFKKALRVKIGRNPNTNEYPAGVRPRPKELMSTDEKAALECLGKSGSAEALFIVQKSAGDQMFFDWLSARGDSNLDARVIRLVSFQIMWAIHTANAQYGLVHRDLKESNTVVREAETNHTRFYTIATGVGDEMDVFKLDFREGDPIVVVIDVGGSFLRVSNKKPRKADAIPLVESAKDEATTPLYHGPEVFMSNRSDRAKYTVSNDLFALGVMVYGMASTGRLELTGITGGYENFSYKRYGDPPPFVPAESGFVLLDNVLKQKDKFYQKGAVKPYAANKREGIPESRPGVLDDLATIAMMQEALGNGAAPPKRPDGWHPSLDFSEIEGFGASNPLRANSQRVVREAIGNNGLLFVRDLLSWDPVARRAFNVPGVDTYGANNGLFHPFFVLDAGYYVGKAASLNQLPGHDAQRDSVFYMDQGHLKRLSDQEPNAQAAFRTGFKDTVYDAALKEAPIITGEQRRARAAAAAARAEEARLGAEEAARLKALEEQRTRLAERAAQRAAEEAAAAAKATQGSSDAVDAAEQGVADADARLSQEQREARTADENAVALADAESNPQPAIDLDALDPNQRTMYDAIGVIVRTLFPSANPPADMSATFTLAEAQTIVDGSLAKAWTILYERGDDTPLDVFVARAAAEADSGTFKAVRRPTAKDVEEILEGQELEELVGMAVRLGLPRRDEGRFLTSDWTKETIVPKIVEKLTEKGYAHKGRGLGFKAGSGKKDEYFLLYGTGNDDEFIRTDALKDIGSYAVYLHGALAALNPDAVPGPSTEEFLDALRDIQENVPSPIDPSALETTVTYNAMSVRMQSTLALVRGPPSQEAVAAAEQKALQEDQDVEEAAEEVARREREAQAARAEEARLERERQEAEAEAQRAREEADAQAARVAEAARLAEEERARLAEAEGQAQTVAADAEIVTLDDEAAAVVRNAAEYIVDNWILAGADNLSAWPKLRKGAEAQPIADQMAVVYNATAEVRETGAGSFKQRNLFADERAAIGFRQAGTEDTKLIEGNDNWEEGSGLEQPTVFDIAAPSRSPYYDPKEFTEVLVDYLYFLEAALLTRYATELSITNTRAADLSALPDTALQGSVAEQRQQSIDAIAGLRDILERTRVATTVTTPATPTPVVPSEPEAPPSEEEEDEVAPAAEYTVSDEQIQEWMNELSASTVRSRLGNKPGIQRALRERGLDDQGSVAVLYQRLVDYINDGVVQDEEPAPPLVDPAPVPVTPAPSQDVDPSADEEEEEDEYAGASLLNVPAVTITQLGKKKVADLEKIVRQAGFDPKVWKDNRPEGTKPKENLVNKLSEVMRRQNLIKLDPDVKNAIGPMITIALGNNNNSLDEIKAAVESLDDATGFALTDTQYATTFELVNNRASWLLKDDLFPQDEDGNIVAPEGVSEDAPWTVRKWAALVAKGLYLAYVAKGTPGDPNAIAARMTVIQNMDQAGIESEEWATDFAAEAAFVGLDVGPVDLAPPPPPSTSPASGGATASDRAAFETNMENALTRFKDGKEPGLRDAWGFAIDFMRQGSPEQQDAFNRAMKSVEGFLTVPVDSDQGPLAIASQKYKKQLVGIMVARLLRVVWIARGEAEGSLVAIGDDIQAISVLKSAAFKTTGRFSNRTKRIAETEEEQRLIGKTGTARIGASPYTSLFQVAGILEQVEHSEVYTNQDGAYNMERVNNDLYGVIHSALDTNHRLVVQDYPALNDVLVRMGIGSDVYEIAPNHVSSIKPELDMTRFLHCLSLVSRMLGDAVAGKAISEDLVERCSVEWPAQVPLNTGAKPSSRSSGQVFNI